MTLTRVSLANPVAVMVGVLLALIFGALSLSRMPVQLTPEVEKPEITIETRWNNASPEEIESEIIEPQEKVLRGLPGMTEMEARAQRGQGRITITFIVGMDMQRALVEVLNRLNRVPFYPEDAEEPTIRNVGGRARAIAWFIFKPVEGNDRHISTYQDFLEEVVQSRFERVFGVAQSEVRGGREREVRISFDPYKAAAVGLQLPKVIGMAKGNRDVSAGNADVGKRRFAIRFAGKMDVEELGNMVLEWRDGNPIRMRDVADVKVQLEDRTGFVIQNGDLAMAVNAYRENGVNVLQVMSELQKAAAELADGPVKRAGLRMEQVYDETVYIDSSIDMVSTNLIMGILLAVGVLWWFLRDVRATLMVAVAIPISIVCTFIFLDSFGRTVNVISLAGLAFAVGMVLDAAIVVLENIVRLRTGKTDISTAAYKGTTQVWGALLASTVTTVAIFLPVVFMKEEAGQLFADLALAIAAAIVFSLVLAITVLPTAAQQYLKANAKIDPHQNWWSNGTQWIMRATDTRKKQTTWVVCLILLPALVWSFMRPPADYLPSGNRNLVFAFILPPPGINVDTIEKEMGQVIAKKMQPYVDGEQEPKVLNYFFVVFGTGVFMGVRPQNPDDTEKLVPLVNKTIGAFPDTLAFARRSSLFGGMSGGSKIDMNIQANDLDSILQAAQMGFRLVRKELPGSTVRPHPGLDLANPELQLKPNERRIAEQGWDRATVSGIVRSLGGGLYIGDYFDGEQRLDVILRSEEWANPEDLLAVPIATPKSRTVPLGELVELQRTAGPEEIRRIDRRRTITLEIRPPEGMALEDAIAIVKQKVEPKLLNVLPEDGDIRYAGTADKLEIMLGTMLSSFLLAFVILYLIISALFRSFVDSLLVLLTIPLASFGGILALNIVDWIVGQKMDLLTMIGFIILLGLVVNNAILLVHQTRESQRDGMGLRDAVENAVQLRLRPILMTTLTSIFGMLPLLLMPGAGTELYRGLAAVIVGGMMVSTVFTLLLLPSLLQLVGVRSTTGQLRPSA